MDELVVRDWKSEGRPVTATATATATSDDDDDMPPLLDEVDYRPVVVRHPMGYSTMWHSLDYRVPPIEAFYGGMGAAQATFRQHEGLIVRGIPGTRRREVTIEMVDDTEMGDPQSTPRRRCRNRNHPTDRRVRARRME